MSEAAATPAAESAPSAAPPAGGDAGAAAAAAPTADVQPSVAPAAGEQLTGQQTGGETKQTSWTETLSDDQKEYVSTKGFKDPAAVLESYKNLEKLRGVPQERLLKLPETPDSPEWESVHNQLGKPTSPDGYGFQPEEGGDEAFLDWAKGAFHESNLTKAQAEALMGKFNEYVNLKNIESEESYAEDVKVQELNLKKEWGSAYHQNIAQAQMAARTFDIPAEAIDALEKTMGYDGVMRVMQNIGSKLGEAAFHSGDSRQGFGEGGEALTPSQAQAKIKVLKADPGFTEKYLAGDSAARDRLSRLHKMAYPDD